MSDKLSIDGIIPGLTESIKKLRHDLHRIPETALEEYKTRERVMEELKDLPLEFHKPYLGTDIVADLIPPGQSEGMIILRADMDGLNVGEKNRFNWKSTHEGKMHACGHDGHMAILTGTAQILCARKDHLKKTIRFVFQPGEEMKCAGHLLAEAGAYEGGTEAYALHGWPGIPQGAIRTKPGVILAATDTFSFTFKGQGTHGATPERGKNPLPGAAQFILEAEKLHHRLNKKWGSVVTPCIVSGGSSANIIPEDCTVSGTTRYLDNDQGTLIEQELRKSASAIADEKDLTLDIEYDRLYYLPVINDSKKAELVLRTALAQFGKESSLRAEKHDMMAEDFAFCLDRVKGCFFQLGLGDNWPSLHAPDFDFNDNSLERGIILFSILGGAFNE